MNNTSEALLRYVSYSDNYPVKLGDNVFQDIVTANSKNLHYDNIISGQTSSSYGNYSLNMAKPKEDCQNFTRDYFLGHTRIDYNITTYDNYSEVSFTASFGDGFWDIIKDADKDGPKNEIPGCTTYPFIPRSWTETFPNPSKMNWQNER